MALYQIANRDACMAWCFPNKIAIVQVAPLHSTTMTSLFPVDYGIGDDSEVLIRPKEYKMHFDSTQSEVKKMKNHHCRASVATEKNWGEEWLVGVNMFDFGCCYDI